MAWTIKEFEINELRAKIEKPLHGMEIANFYYGDDFRKVPNVSVNFNWVHPSPPPPLLGNPRENFSEQANPGHPGKFFVLFHALGQKMMGEFPGGGAKFSQTRRKCSVLSLQKSFKN